MTKTLARSAALAASLLVSLVGGAARAADTGDDAPAETFALHVQATVTEQFHPAFHSPYQGAASLDAGARGNETADVTLYAGVRLWQGAEFWVNPEIDQGFGLSNTLGVAGFPSGEAYKVGARDPYFKLQRAFVRQTFDLGGNSDKTEADLNVLGGSHTTDRLVITAGKLSAVDVFDTNSYAHDPRQDFLNWSLIDTGSFDYAADAWGYTYGVAAEWYRGPWTMRVGVFDLSVTPNSPALDVKFDQYQQVAEIERRYMLGGQMGKVALSGFITHGRMGNFEEAIALSLATGQPANVALVRKYTERSGVSVNAEQSLTETLGLFVRAGEAGGDKEPFEFADIDQTVAAGMSQGGKPWGRADDKAAIAFVVNDISKVHQAYLAVGGTGILVGDGQLPHPGAERIVEAYYSVAAATGLHVTLDYQFIQNPAYNRDRGPASVLGLRLHAQY